MNANNGSKVAEMVDQRVIIKETVQHLRAGEVILYPTDTVWGLGCDASNEEAVLRLMALKHRAPSKSMLLLLGRDALLPSYVKEVPDIAYDLIDCAVDPLTIVYPQARNVAPSLIADDGSIGIRIPQNGFIKELCQAFRGPIVSTSANWSGETTPAFFDEIADELKAAVDYIVPYGQKDRTRHKPSSIIKIGLGGEVKVIRE